MYINDFETHLANNDRTSVEISMLNLYLLLYADDTVILLLSETDLDLQCILNKIYIANKLETCS